MAVILWDGALTAVPAQGESYTELLKRGVAIFHLNTDPAIALVIGGHKDERAARAAVIVDALTRSRARLAEKDEQIAELEAQVRQLRAAREAWEARRGFVVTGGLPLAEQVARLLPDTKGLADCIALLPDEATP